MDFVYEQERIYAADTDGKITAEITFPERDGIADINHTFVDDSLRGQGVAGRLVRAAADQILRDGNKISASCPYASAWLDRHREDCTVSEQSAAGKQV
jgi:predicted GNAT family acetyltransferase